MARIEKTVFISYRRADVYTALAVYENLKNQGYDVFFDYRSISSGDFEQIITANIRARAHFVLILTPTALDRCNEPGDWLRREIELAIDEQRNIVPLFFKGFRFGSPNVRDKLTGTMQHLSRYNGLNVHEDYFDEAMERLRTQYLDIPLNTVLHPLSTEAQRVARSEQSAADQALENIENVKDLVKQTNPGLVRKSEVPKLNVPQAGKTEAKQAKTWQMAISLVVGIAVIFICIVSAVIIYSNWPSAYPDPSQTSWPVTTAPAINPEATETFTPESTLTPSLTQESTATGLPTATPFPTFVSSQVTLQSVPYSEENPGANFPPYTIKAQIPQLSGSGDVRVQALNQSLSNFVLDKLSYYRQQFKQLDFALGTTKSDVEGTYTLLSQVGDVWSFRFDFSYYLAGAAHPNVDSIALSFDLTLGRQLALSDLFIANSNYLELISNYCITQLSNEYGDAFFSEGAQPTLENYKNWTVTPDGILITFDAYQVAPGAAGTPQIEIPYNELSSIIQRDGPLTFLYR